MLIFYFEIKSMYLKQIAISSQTSPLNLLLLVSTASLLIYLLCTSIRRKRKNKANAYGDSWIIMLGNKKSGATWYSAQLLKSKNR